MIIDITFEKRIKNEVYCDDDSSSDLFSEDLFEDQTRDNQSMI